jgi:hypothetical protein
MGYLPSFIEDVFISYAHNDDDAYAMESQGWVAQLDEDLRKRVAVYLDGKKPEVWRDREIRANEDFAEKIAGRLLTTATFISIITPSFFGRPWCIRELDEFVASAEHGLGIKIGVTKRIFKVEKVPLSMDRNALPNSLQGSRSYQFYGPDPEHQNRIKEYRPKLGVDYAAKYWREMDDLAQDIATTLKVMHANPTDDGANALASATVAAAASAMPAMTVYLAETTSDLDEEIKEIRRDLKARGFTVLPDGDLPYRKRDLKSKVMEDLGQAQLSIQLVGNEYGYVPEGESEKSNEWLQNDFSIEHQNATPGFIRLLWMPTGLAPTDARQKRLVEYLHNDPVSQHGADLIESKLEDLKTVVQEKVKILREGVEKKKAPPVAVQEADDEPVRIYVICDQRDLASRDLRDLKSYLFSQGYECILPSDNEDEREALQEHADNLSICDACLIYYGQGSERWFGTKLRELRKLLSQRTQPVRAKGVYVAPPAGTCKEELQTLEAIVLRGAEVFSPAALTPFLSRLRPAAKGEGA